MAKFTQHIQNLQYQFNADTINFGAVKTPEDCLPMIQALQAEAQKAIEAKAVQGEEAVDLKACLEKAVLKAEEPEPDKQSLLDYLTKAKELVGGVSGLAAAIGTAITTIGALF